MTGEAAISFARWVSMVDNLPVLSITLLNVHLAQGFIPMSLQRSLLGFHRDTPVVCFRLGFATLLIGYTSSVFSTAPVRSCIWSKNDLHNTLTRSSSMTSRPSISTCCFTHSTTAVLPKTKWGSLPRSYGRVGVWSNRKTGVATRDRFVRARVPAPEHPNRSIGATECTTWWTESMPPAANQSHIDGVGVRGP